MNQELGIAAPIEIAAPVSDRTIRRKLTLLRFATSLLWITPFSVASPSTPEWIEARREGGSVLLRWTPNREPDFYRYDLLRIDGETRSSIGPVPLRGAIWVDDAPTFDASLAYEVRAISASGVPSATAPSAPVQRSGG